MTLGNSMGIRSEIQVALVCRMRYQLLIVCHNPELVRTHMPEHGSSYGKPYHHPRGKRTEHLAFRHIDGCDREKNEMNLFISSSEV